MLSKIRCSCCGDADSGPHYHSKNWHDVICADCYATMTEELEEDLSEVFGRHTYIRTARYQAAEDAAKAAMDATWEVVEE